LRNVKIGLAGASASPCSIRAYGPIGAVGFVGKKINPVSGHEEMPLYGVLSARVTL